jgi:hypothetical protein
VGTGGSTGGDNGAVKTSLGDDIDLDGRVTLDVVSTLSGADIVMGRPTRES